MQSSAPHLMAIAFVGLLAASGSGKALTLPPPSPVAVMATAPNGSAQTYDSQAIASQHVNAAELRLNQETQLNPAGTYFTLGHTVAQSVGPWRRSPLWTGGQAGPTDQQGRGWNAAQFDDSSWSTVTLPDTGQDSNADDRYYRSHFSWDGASTVTLSFAADDGLSIYINGFQLGSWGQQWRQGGV